MRLDFHFTGAGWLDLEIANGSDDARLEWLSDVGEGIGDLVRTALAVVAGAWRSEMAFDLEPGKLRVVAERAYWEDNRWVLQPRVQIFDERVGVGEAGLVFKTYLDSLDEFGVAVLSSVEELEAKDQSGTFGKEWPLEPYPGRAIAALRAALELPDKRD